MTKRNYEWTEVTSGLIISAERFAEEAAAAGISPEEYAASIERAWGGHMRISFVVHADINSDTTAPLPAA